MADITYSKVGGEILVSVDDRRDAIVAIPSQGDPSVEEYPNLMLIRHSGLDLLNPPNPQAKACLSLGCWINKVYYRGDLNVLGTALMGFAQAICTLNGRDIDRLAGVDDKGPRPAERVDPSSLTAATEHFSSLDVPVVIGMDFAFAENDMPGITIPSNLGQLMASEPSGHITASQHHQEAMQRPIMRVIDKELKDLEKWNRDLTVEEVRDILYRIKAYMPL